MRCRTSGPGLCRSIFSASVLFAVCAAWGATARAQDTTLSKREAEYQAETDPVRKAKLLAKLGPAEIADATRNLKADEDEKALAVLERYRDEVRKTADALMGTGANAVRHPAGFKELQIGLRESLRRLNDLILMVPLDERPWFEAVRSDLSATQNSLMEALFPSPDEKKRPKNGKRG